MTAGVDSSATRLYYAVDSAVESVDSTAVQPDCATLRLQMIPLGRYSCVFIYTLSSFKPIGLSHL